MLVVLVLFVPLVLVLVLSVLVFPLSFYPLLYERVSGDLEELGVVPE